MIAGFYLVRVFTFGLVAYVTNSADKPTDFSLVLIDARHPPIASDGCPNNRHIPLLMYQAPSGTCSPWCRLELGLCQCPLERVELEFDTSTLKPLDPKSMSCEEMDDYVHELNPMIGGIYRARSECMSDPHHGRVCPFVVARLEDFPPQYAYACELALGGDASSHELQRPKQGDKTMQYRKFRFRPMAKGGYRMFSGREMLATRMVLVREAKASEIKITASSFDRAETQDLLLSAVPCPDSVKKERAKEKRSVPDGCIDVVIGNAPVHSEHHLLYGRCQGHGIDRDFELLGDLVKGNLNLSSRRVPYDSDKKLTQAEKMGKPRDSLCDSSLFDAFERWLRTDQATSECTGGGLRKPGV